MHETAVFASELRAWPDRHGWCRAQRMQRRRPVARLCASDMESAFRLWQPAPI